MTTKPLPRYSLPEGIDDALLELKRRGGAALEQQLAEFAGRSFPQLKQLILSLGLVIQEQNEIRLSDRGFAFSVANEIEKPVLLMRSLIDYEPYRTTLRQAIEADSDRIDQNQLIEWWESAYPDESPAEIKSASLAFLNLLSHSRIGDLEKGRGKIPQLTFARTGKAVLSSELSQWEQRQRAIAQPERNTITAKRRSRQAVIEPEGSPQPELPLMNLPIESEAKPKRQRKPKTPPLPFAADPSPEISTVDPNGRAFQIVHPVTRPRFNERVPKEPLEPIAKAAESHSLPIPIPAPQLEIKIDMTNWEIEKIERFFKSLRGQSD